MEWNRRRYKMRRFANLTGINLNINTVFWPFLRFLGACEVTFIHRRQPWGDGGCIPQKFTVGDGYTTIPLLYS